MRATGVITVDTSFGSSITSASRFLARRTFQREIDRAWEDILAMVQTKGYRPALIMNSEDLRTVHLYWTLAKICRNLSKSTEDIWWERGKQFAEAFTTNMGFVEFRYDSNEDNWPDSRKSFKPGFRR